MRGRILLVVKPNNDKGLTTIAVMRKGKKMNRQTGKINQPRLIMTG